MLKKDGNARAVQFVASADFQQLTSKVGKAAVVKRWSRELEAFAGVPVGRIVNMTLTNGGLSTYLLYVPCVVRYLSGYLCVLDLP